MCKLRLLMQSWAYAQRVFATYSSDDSSSSSPSTSCKEKTAPSLLESSFLGSATLRVSRSALFRSNFCLLLVKLDCTKLPLLEAARLFGPCEFISLIVSSRGLGFPRTGPSHVGAGPSGACLVKNGRNLFCLLILRFWVG